MDILECRDLTEITRRDRFREKLSSGFKGVNVITTVRASIHDQHRGDMKQRFRIGSVSAQVMIILTCQSAQDYRFEMDGHQISMVNRFIMYQVEYFKKQYNIDIKYPYLPVIFKVCIGLIEQANGKTGFPMEFLSVAPSQRYMHKLSGQQTSGILI